MSKGRKIESEKLTAKLQEISKVISETVEICQDDTLGLLAILRQLEQLHREIREEVFQKGLPDNRQALYSLLKDIESQGGWPYIEKMKLKAFLANLVPDETEEEIT